MNKIILFSDLHFGNNVEGKQRKGINTFGNTSELLLKLIDIINHFKPLAVFNLGDVVTSKNIEEKTKMWDYLQKDYFSRILSPLYFIQGNHDFYNINMNDYKRNIKHPLPTSFIMAGYKHILIDMEIISSDSIDITDNTFKWLKEELKDNIPSILYSHLPISESIEGVSYYHVNRPNKGFLERSKEIKELLKKSKCKLVVNGHSHFYYETIVDGIKHITIPSFSENVNCKANGEYCVLDLDTLGIEIKKVEA